MPLDTGGSAIARTDSRVSPRKKHLSKPVCSRRWAAVLVAVALICVAWSVRTTVLVHLYVESQPAATADVVCQPPTGVVSACDQWHQLPRAGCCSDSSWNGGHDDNSVNMAAETADPRANWKVLIVTLLGGTWVPENEVGATSMANKQRYARRHGYSVVNGAHLVNTTRRSQWSKPLIVAHYLRTRPDVDLLAFVDADTLFMRMDVPLVSFVHPELDTVVMASDFNGINSGVYMVRNTEWARRWFGGMWNVGPTPRHCSYYDQYAVQLLLGSTRCHAATRALPTQQEVEDARRHVRIVPQRVMNSYPASSVTTLRAARWAGRYEHGDFMVHLAGTWWQSKTRLFMAIAKRVTNRGKLCATLPVANRCREGLQVPAGD